MTMYKSRVIHVINRFVINVPKTYSIVALQAFASSSVALYVVVMFWRYSY